MESSQIKSQFNFRRVRLRRYVRGKGTGLRRKNRLSAGVGVIALRTMGICKSKPNVEPPTIADADASKAVPVAPGEETPGRPDIVLNTWVCPCAAPIYHG